MSAPAVRWTRVEAPVPGPRSVLADLRLGIPALCALAAVWLCRVVRAPGPGWLVVAVALTGSAVGALEWVESRQGERGERDELRERTGRQAALVCIALLAAGTAAGGGTLRTEVALAHPLRAHLGHTTGVEAVTTGFPRAVTGGAVAVPVRVEATGSGTSARAGVLAVTVLARERAWTRLAPGTRIRATVRVREDSRGAPEPLLVAVGGLTVLRPAPAQGRVPARIRDELASGARAVLPEDRAGLLTAMTLGDERAVPPGQRESFRQAGLSHLSAVSGANVTLVVLGAGVLAAVLGAGRRLRLLASVGALVAFVAVVGAEPSVLRAAATGGIGLLALAGARRFRPVVALSAFVLVECLIDPRTATGLGFTLSTVAALALVLAARPAVGALRRLRVPRAVAEVIAVCVVAHLATWPVLAAAGLAGGWCALPANVAAAPAVPWVTWCGTAAAGWCALFGDGPPVRALAWCARPALWWLDGVARVAAGFAGPG